MSRVYRKDKYVVEDGLFVEMFIQNILTHESLAGEKESYTQSKALLKQDLKRICGSNNKLYNKIFKLARRKSKYFVKNKFDTRKCFMTLTIAASALHDAEVVELPQGLLQVLEDMNVVVMDAAKGKLEGKDVPPPEEVVLIFKSAEKHAQRFINELQEEEYYNG